MGGEGINNWGTAENTQQISLKSALIGNITQYLQVGESPPVAKILEMPMRYAMLRRCPAEAGEMTSPSPV